MNPTELQLRREDCRRAVRTWLYERQAVAQSAVTIWRGVYREHAFTQEEVAAALSFWTGLEQLKSLPVAAGATLQYQITATGILAEERGQ